MNILEAGWGRNHKPGDLTYEAELVDCGKLGQAPLTFFAYEWINPRRGIQVKEVRLKAAKSFRNVDGHASPPNSVLLAAVSVVKKRTPPEPKPLRVSGT